MSSCGASKNSFLTNISKNHISNHFFQLDSQKNFLKLIKNLKSLNILLLTEHHKNILLNEKIENKRIFIMPNYIENSSTTSSIKKIASFMQEEFLMKKG